MNSIDDQFRRQECASEPPYIVPAQGNVGWQGKRLIVGAWNALLQLDAHQAERYLAQLRHVECDAPIRQQMLAQHVTLLDAGLALVRDDVEGAMALANRVSVQRQTEEMARATSVLLRFGAWRLRNWLYFEEARCICPCSLIDKRQAVPTILTLVVEAAAEMKRSRMDVAKRLAADALRFATKLQASKSLVTANAAAVMGELLYQQGDLEEAEKLLRRHLAQISRCGFPDAVDAAYGTLAHAAFDRGQLKIAGLLVNELVTIGKLRSWPRLVALGYGREIELRCSLADPVLAHEALHHLRGVLDGEMPALTRAEIEQLVQEAEFKVRLLVEPSHDLALALRDRIEHDSKRGDNLRALKMSMLLVEVLVLTGRDEEADDELLTCLRIGMQSGVFQLFLGGSAILRDKLHAVYNGALLTASFRAELRGYLASLVSRERERVVAKTGPSGGANKDAITLREREILLRMSHGHSNKKIAKDLGIGPETVKSHAKRIFFKLGVTERIEAVTCANDLSLL